jgi:hypothetical protein
MPKVFMRHKSINYYSGPETPIAKIRKQLLQSSGGSVDLVKNEDTGIATLCLNHPERRNAISGNNNSNSNNNSVRKIIRTITVTTTIMM